MKLLIVLCAFYSFFVQAYNASKCEKYLSKHLITSRLMVSSSSYFSSTGDCAMIGEVEHDKKVFIAFNLDKIQTDAAKGQGEYLETYALIAGCSKPESKLFAQKLKNQFSEVFGKEKLDSIPVVYGRIERLFENNRELRSCKSSS